MVGLYDTVDEITWNGIANQAMRWIQERQLKDRALWRIFVNQFRLHSDRFGEWRGEYWGKMMRGAVMVWQYTRDEELYQILTETVEDLLSVQNADGSFSTYPSEHAFTAWDMWCRKYVLLGLEHYLEICEDLKLRARIMDAMRAHADAILDLVGDVSEGKTPVVETSNIYGGMNSASVLEPMVRLYRLSGEERYLAFARHIISSGGSNIANIFRLAHEDKTPPYLYGVNKAYEMMSCFEGVIEYYEVTGDAFCRDAAIRFAHQVINSDVTVIGCCGTESELFDHSAVRQTRNVKGPLQETCVSVTWMKLCRRLLLITGDTAFLDEIERTYYNAFLGALNTEDKRSADLVNDGQGTRRFLAFDSYSPLTVGHRGILTGGAQPLEDGTAYGCCAAIGAAGSAVFPKSAVLVEDGGVFIGLYEEGSVKVTLSDGTNLKIVTETAYPSDGKIRITLLPDRQSEFKLSIRVPAWSRQTRLTVCGEQVNVDKTGKCCLKRLWNSGDILELTLDMRVYLLRAPHYDSDIFYRIDWSNGKMLPTRICQAEQDRNHACFMRGPLVLAASARLGWSSERSQVITEANGSEIDSTDAERSEVPYPCMVACRVKPLQGDELLMTDYASAGKQWCKEDRFAAWIPARFQS